MNTTSVLLVLLLASGPKEKTGAYPRPELLLEPTELAKPVGTQFRILDARPRADYETAHIPGAGWVDHDAWSKAFAARRDASEWARRIGSLGIRAHLQRVVVYDDHLGNRSARIWWILKYWGIKDVRLLNGQWKGWKASGGPVTDQVQAVAAQQFTGSAVAKSGLATKEQILEALPKSGLQIIDARSGGEFCGRAETAKRNGSIPGARHLEWSDTLDRKTERFKSAAQIRELFRRAGVNPNRPSVTYCQSGGRAAVLAFVLELMGATDVRNYYRSWAEWGNSDSTPIARPKEKTGN